MGLQIPRGIYPEEAKEGDLWWDPEIPGEDAARVSGSEGMPNCRRAPDVGSHSHVHQHPAEVLGLECSGVHQGQKRHWNCAALYGQEPQL